MSDKFPAWTQPANKMKLQIVLRNFTSYPKQSKNTEASKSDKEENSFAAGACAKNKPLQIGYLISWLTPKLKCNIWHLLYSHFYRMEGC